MGQLGLQMYCSECWLVRVPVCSLNGRRGFCADLGKGTQVWETGPYREPLMRHMLAACKRGLCKHRCCQHTRQESLGCRGTTATEPPSAALH